MARKKTGKQGEPDQVVSAKRVLRGVLRSRRECSISEYLVLLELASASKALSTTALERRLRGPGMTNPRQAVSKARVHGWVACASMPDRGSEWWLTQQGAAVVAGLLARLGGGTSSLAQACAAGAKRREDLWQMMLNFDKNEELFD